MTAVKLTTRILLHAVLVVACCVPATTFAGPPKMMKNWLPLNANKAVPNNGPKFAKMQPKLKIAKPLNQGVIGNQPQIIPGVGGQLKPVPGWKPGPKPQPPANPKPNNDWWKPLANPGTWAGILGAGGGHHHPNWPNHDPHYPVDPGFNPGWHDPSPYDPEPMPIDPGWSQAPVPDVPENSLGEPVEVLNPPESKTVIGFRVSGHVVKLQPGQSIPLPAGRSYEIEFHRGGSFGVAKYGMTEGLHWFKKTDHGWELYRGSYSPTQPAAPKSDDLPQNDF